MRARLVFQGNAHIFIPPVLTVNIDFDACAERAIELAWERRCEMADFKLVPLPRLDHETRECLLMVAMRPCRCSEYANGRLCESCLAAKVLGWPAPPRAEVVEEQEGEDNE